ncbi:MAG: NADH-quinone oxidoreductase subunit J [Peptococcaceae bacterium]|nr:NADH-quinone oxidoreductase subunit J [Peptococcaceae bacterium]
MFDGIDWLGVFFYILSAVIVVSALLVVFSKNIVHSVLWLVISFIAVAGIFITLNADFLALIQVMVYAGAICIMVVLGIMLIKRDDMNKTNMFNSQLYFGGAVALMVTFLTGFASYKINYSGNPPMVPENSVESIATLLLSKYVIPFEVVALLLTVTLVGAIYIAREVKADADS